ncbi:hypothetical protein OROHE_019393 [Orobanche hederae]
MSTPEVAAEVGSGANEGENGTGAETEMTHDLESIDGVFAYIGNQAVGVDLEGVDEDEDDEFEKGNENAGDGARENAQNGGDGAVENAQDGGDGAVENAQDGGENTHNGEGVVM